MPVPLELIDKRIDETVLLLRNPPEGFEAVEPWRLPVAVFTSPEHNRMLFTETDTRGRICERVYERFVAAREGEPAVEKFEAMALLCGMRWHAEPEIVGKLTSDALDLVRAGRLDRAFPYIEFLRRRTEHLYVRDARDDIDALKPELLLRATECLRAMPNYGAFGDAPGSLAWIETRALLGILAYLDPTWLESEGIGPWGAAARETVRSLPDDARGAWEAILAHAARAGQGAPKPAWIRKAAPLLDAVGDDFAPFAIRLLSFMSHFAHDGETTVEFDANVLKGLASLLGSEKSEERARMLGDVALQAVRHVKGRGPLLPRVGNAALYALESMGEMYALRQIARIRRKARTVPAQKLIAEALERAARGLDLSVDELEDLMAPTAGFDPDGRREEKLGDCAAIVELELPMKVRLSWRTADGAPAKSAPASIASAFKDEIKDLKAAVKDLEAQLPVQRDRLERMFLARREFALADWTERFPNHPVLSFFARRLIWRFERNGRVGAGAWLDGGIAGPDDALLDWLTLETRVRLWHPLDAPDAEIEAWRERTHRREVMQPFKQAYRETYVVTDAERGSYNHSLRFAGHILRQGPFLALAKQRGWRCDAVTLAEGGLDAVATRPLPGTEIEAQVLVRAFAGIPGDPTRSYVAPCVTTESLRFVRPDFNPVPLETIAPIHFSETMRDLDLFASVASIGLDERIRETAPERLRPYFARFDQADRASVQTREEALKRIVPRLSVADRCRVEGGKVIVRGDLNEYAISIASGSVMARGRHLCILPAPATESPFVPHDGDYMLSVVLSKTLTFARDKKITDPSILGQIGGFRV